MNEKTQQSFEEALRDLGVPRLRLDQVVNAYHRAFPANAMRPDMRERLHDALLQLINEGVITVSTQDGAFGDDPLGLPRAIEFTDESFSLPS